MIYELTDECYRMYSQIREDGSFMVRLFCVNPSANLSACWSRGTRRCSSPPTLLPVNYYKELLTGNREEYAVYASSPISQGKSPADHRGGREQPVHQAQSAGVWEDRRVYREDRHGKGGKLHGIFPLLPVYGAGGGGSGEERNVPFQWICQKSHMGEREREEFLARFEERRDVPFAALCVLGGLFSEGIDLKEERAHRGGDRGHGASPGERGAGDFEGVF